MSAARQRPAARPLAGEAAERVVAFTALCDPKRAIEIVEAALGRDTSQPVDDQERPAHEARAKNLAKLRH